MINILDFSETRFTLDGVQYLKNYISRISEDRITIFNCYDNRDVLLPWTSYNEVNLNGLVHSSAQELHSEILDVIYFRTTLGNSPSFVQNNVGIEMFVGELSGSGSITSVEAATAFNLLNYSISVSAIRTPVVISFTRSQKKYMFLFKKGQGIWGSANGSNSNYPIYTDDLIALPALNLTAEDIQTQNGANIIPLGNLPTGDYLTAANSAQRDFNDAGTLNEDGYPITYYFSYTQDGVLYFVQFVGTPAVYNGNLQASDLVSTTNNTVTSELDLQGAMNNGSEAIVNTPITFVYDNGSVNVKIALNEDGLFLTNNNNTVQVKAGTVAVGSTVSGLDGVEDEEFVTKQQLDTKLNIAENIPFENLSDISTIMGFAMFTRLGEVFRSAFLKWYEEQKVLSIEGTQFLIEPNSAVNDGNAAIKGIVDASEAMKFMIGTSLLSSFGISNGKNIWRFNSVVRYLSGSAMNDVEFSTAVAQTTETVILKTIPLPVDSVVTVDILNISVMNVDGSYIVGKSQFSFKNDSGTITAIGDTSVNYQNQYSSLVGGAVSNTETRIEAVASGSDVVVNFVNTVNKLTNINCRIEHNIVNIPIPE